jgi:hypothetical protein
LLNESSDCFVVFGSNKNCMYVDGIYMDAGIDDREGSCVGARGELIPGVQVQQLFENILRGWSYKVEGTFG